MEVCFVGSFLSISRASFISFAKSSFILEQFASVTLICNARGIWVGEIFQFFVFPRYEDKLNGSIYVVVKVTTQSSGLPITVIP